MEFKEVLEKIEASGLFKEFREKHPEAELCAGFFVLDFLSNDNKHSLDYLVGDKVFTFDINDKEKVFMKEDELLDVPGKPKLSRIKPECNVEVGELKGIVGIEALENGISGKIHKIIAVMQNHESRQVWNLTCMLEGLIILHVLVDSDSREILKFERRSMMDLIKKKG